MEFDLLIVGVGVEEALLAAKNAKSGKRIVNIGRVGEKYGGQHSTVKGVDTLPLVLTPKGELSSNLIDLKAADYISFVPFETVTVLTSSLAPIKVPLKKEHVMLDQSISLRDKRRLMSIIASQSCLPTISDDETAYSWLKSLHIDESVIEMIMYGVCFVPGKLEYESLKMSDLKRKLEIFSCSLPNPLLYPLYGSSEIAQALIRVAAVHGATQILEQPSTDRIVHEGKDVTVNFLEKVDCSTEYFSCSHAYAFSPYSLYGECNLRIYVIAPCGQYQDALFCMQLDPSSCCCKTGYLFHFWSFNNNNIQERMEKLFGDRDFFVSLQFNTFPTCNKSFVY
jgi:RAB protein geranylgeranyltransferase component A